MQEEKDPESQSFKIEDSNLNNEIEKIQNSLSNGDHYHGGNKCQKNHSHHHRGPNNNIVIFTIAMPTNCVILQYFWLDEILKDNPFEYQFARLTLFIIYILSMISYYYAVNLTNKPCKAIAALEETQNFDPVYFNNIQCNTCTSWKPLRTSHCSQCNKCTLRMDHHCPWIVNCVGARNHRAFMQFTVYMTMGGLNYCYRTWTYFRFLQGQENFWQNGNFFYVFWIFTSCVLFPITIMLFSLSLFHSILILQSLTTMDIMKGRQLKNPFLPEMSKKSYNYINIFDRGIITNLKIFFESDLFFFWLPYPNFTDSDGIYSYFTVLGTVFPTNPHCNAIDMQKMLKQSEISCPDLPEIIDIHQCSTNYDELIEKEKHKYKDSNFQIKDKIFEYWKDYEKEEQQKNKQADILNDQKTDQI